MAPNTPNPASAAARTGSGNDVCFGGEQFPPDSATAQKYQARISRGVSLRENGCPGHNPGQPITWPFLAKKGPNSEINSKANRVRRQDVLDRPRLGFHVVLPRAVRGRGHGACFRAQRQLERVAPHGADEPKGCSRGMKSRRGPSSRRPPHCRARWQP
jgi:hypothetical protein